LILNPEWLLDGRFVTSYINNHQTSFINQRVSGHQIIRWTVGTRKKSILHAILVIRGSDQGSGVNP
jgi:hypothetical protein